MCVSLAVVRKFISTVASCGCLQCVQLGRLACAPANLKVAFDCVLLGMGSSLHCVIRSSLLDIGHVLGPRCREEHVDHVVLPALLASQIV